MKFTTKSQSFTFRKIEDRILFDGVAPDLAPDSSEAIDSELNSNDSTGAPQTTANFESEAQSTTMELVIVDTSVDDYQRLVNDLLSQNGDRNFEVVLLDDASDGVRQVDAILAGFQRLDSIHFVSHGEDAAFRLGDTWIDEGNLDQYSEQIAGWGDALSSDGDILFYGCKLAESDSGRALVDSIASLTNADVGASSDNTGAAFRSGDWDLEYRKGDVNSDIAFTQSMQSSYNHILAVGPDVQFASTSVQAQLGQDFSFTVSFDNTGTSLGYGPFIDLIFPVNGADGAAGTDVPDGIDFVSASYLGQALSTIEFTFPDDDGAGVGTTGTIDHPFAKDNLGNPLQITGTAGDKLVVLELPFGSFAPNQPVADISVTASISNLADLGTGLDIQTRSGFRFGSDPLDNPTTDPSVVSDSGTDVSDSSDVAKSWTEQMTVTPTLMSLTKTYIGPEDETVTGPNYVRQYRIDIDIPDGQTISNLDIIDSLPNNVVVTSIDSVLVNGVGAAYTDNLGSLTFPGNNQDLIITPDSPVTGTTSSADVSVTFSFYVDEFDGDTNRVIPITGEDDTTNAPDSRSHNNARAVGDWEPNDSSRDSGGTDNAIADPNPSGPEHTLDDKAIAIQKSVSVVTDTGATGTTPGDTLEYVLTFQISDYYTFGDLIIDDIFQDGQLFDFSYGATFDITDSNGNVTGSFTVREIGDADAGQTLVVDQTQVDRTDDSGEDGVTADGTDGSTTLRFDLSKALTDNGAADGVLQGGLSDGATNKGSATGTIRFRTVIQEEFADTFSSGDRSVDQGDNITNSNLTLSGTVRENAEANGGTGDINVVIGNEDDDSSASISIAGGNLTKEIFAVNGSQTLNYGNSGRVTMTPGDTVTYRLQYVLSTTDFEQLKITDYFPLPIFDADDFNADGVSGDTWTFDSDATFDGIAGTIEVGANDTFFALSGVTPGISTSPGSNSLELDFGNYDDPASTSSTIELYVTLVAQDSPTADGLYLTNIARLSEGTTGNESTVLDDIVQIEVLQPELSISKGVVSASRSEVQKIEATEVPGGVDYTITLDGQTTGAISILADASTVQSQLESLSNIGVGNVLVSGGPIVLPGNLIGTPFTIEFTGDLQGKDVAELTTNVATITVDTLKNGPQYSTTPTGPVPFENPNSANPAFTTGFTSADLLSNPVNSDVSDLESSERVKFAIVIENTGGADAFDTLISDTYASGFKIPTSGAGLNLEVRNGDGVLLGWTGVDTGTAADLFGGGIRINDNGSQGGINNIDDATSASDGSNIVVITYDLELDDSVGANETIQNTGYLNEYAGQEGGTDYVAGNISEAASATTSNFTVNKSIDSTSESLTTELGGVERVVVGEIIRYRLELALPEGSFTDLKIRDVLPTGLTFIDDGTSTLALVSDSNGISSSTLSGTGLVVTGNESNLGSIEPTYVLPDLAISKNLGSHNDSYTTGQDVYFALGDISNTDNDSNVEYVVLEFNVLVDNNSADSTRNDVGENRYNDVRVYVDGSQTYDMPNSDRPRVMISEPLLENLIQTANANTGDAGDIVTYTIAFGVASGNTRTDAFDVNVSSSIPAGLENVSFSEIRVNGVALPSGFTNNSTGTALDLIIDSLAKGDSVEVDYTATVKSSVSSTDIITNRAEVTWSSLPGTFGTNNGTGGNSTGSDLQTLNGVNTGNIVYDTSAGMSHGERNGSGLGDPADANDDVEPNDYHGTHAHAFTVSSTSQITKTLDGTSISHVDNTATEAVIGELVTYTVKIDFNESTLPNAQLVDTLDAGLAFVGVTSVSTTGGVIYTGDANNPATVTGNGTVVTWDLGTLSDSTPGDANGAGDTDGSLSITYQAIVTNVGTNLTAQTLDNNVEFTWDDDPVNAPNPRESLTTSANLPVAVIEPEITVTAAAAVDVDGDGFDDGTSADAGDQIRYTFEITNTSGVDAFDLSFLNNLPMAGGSSAIISPTLSVTDTDAVVGNSDFSLTGSNAAGWTLSSIANIDFASDPLRKITVVVTGSLSSNVQPESVVTDASTVTWESIDGASGTSAHTTDDTERDGSGGINDYTATAGANITVTAPTILKQILGTGINTTTNSNSQATIGEYITYSVTIEIPEGNMSTVNIIDQLDAGLEFVELDSITASNGLSTDLAVDDFDTLSNFNPTVTGFGTTASPYELTFDLGNINNSDSNNAVSETVTLVYRAKVMNSPDASGNGGAAGDSLGNSAHLEWNAGANSTASSSANVEVVEADLQAVTSLTSSATADAGDNVTYRVVISHTANSDTDAFDVTFADPMPDELNFVSVNATLASSGDLNSLFEYDATSRTLRTIPGSTFDLAFGQTVTVDISATLITAETEPGETISNTASIAWTSLDAANATDGDDSTERTGSGTGENQYSDSSLDSSLTISVPTIGKTLIGTSVNTLENGSAEGVIGELVTYEVTLNLKEGTYNQLKLMDALDSGLEFVSLDNITRLSGGIATTDITTDRGVGDFTDLASFAPTQSGGFHIFDLGTVTNANSDNLENETLVIRYTTRIANIIGNNGNGTAQGTLLGNAAHIEWTADAVGKSSNTSNAVDVEVLEPQLQIVQTVADDTPNLGDTASFQIAIDHTLSSDTDAYDLVISETLPSQLTLDEGSFVVKLGSTTLTPNVDYSLSTTTGSFSITNLDYANTGDQLTIDYTATVTSTISEIGATFNNTANLTWTSLDGTNSNERDGDGGNSGEDDYSDSSPESLTIVQPDLRVTIENGVSAVVPGSSYTYDIVVHNDGTDAATGINVSDLLDGSVFDLTSLTTDDPTNVAYSSTTGQLDWDAGSIAIGSSKTLKVTVSVLNSIAAGIDDVDHIATATHSDIEPTALNNTANDLDLVNANPVLTLTKTDGVTEADLNDTLTYTLNYANSGNQDAKGVEIIETLPSGTTFAGTVGWTSIGSGQYRYTIGDLAAGASGSVTFAVTVNDPQPVSQHTISNSATIDDDNNNGGTPGIDDTATDTTDVPSSLSGRVYNDHDNDGLFESGDGETGIAGVRIELYDTSSGSPVFVSFVNTGSDGTYSFSGLMADQYEIRQIQPTNYNDGQETDGSEGNGDVSTNDRISSIELNAGVDASGYHFAEQGVSISGTVFVDDNRDSIRQVGESTGVDNVLIELFESDGTTKITETYTDSNGDYQFNHLPAADYIIKQTHPSQYTSTSPNTISLTAGLGGATEQNFGEALWDLGDYIWFDLDNDSVQDAGEGIGNVDVRVTYAGLDNDFDLTADNIIYLTTTDANGMYRVDELFNGSYRVEIVSGIPNGSTGIQETDDSAALIDGTSHISISDGDRFDIDFGYSGSGTIGNFVFDDVDGDGIQDPEDVGLAGINLTIEYAGVDGDFGLTDDNLTFTTTTDSSGNYSINHLPDGSFRVTVDAVNPNLPNSMVGVSGTESKSGTVDVTLVGGETNNTIDFGYTGTLTLGDRVWFDADGDGVQDLSNEPGFGDVQVSLHYAGQDGIFGTMISPGDDVFLTQVTDSDGNYNFSNLADGEYRITYDGNDLPPTMSGTYETDDSAPAIDGQSNITLAGSNRTDVNFGFRGAGTIGDRVWHDADGDGIQEAGEPGLAAITVELEFAGEDGVFGNSDDFSLATITDANGNYSFHFLPDGNHRVNVGLSDPDLPGSLIGVTGTGSVAGIVPVTIDGTNGRIHTDLDFGFRGIRSVGSSVWFDANGDGLQGTSTDEPGFGSVAVTLQYAGQDGVFGTISSPGDDIFVTTTTDADGNYQFENISDGDFRVSVESGDLPSGLSQTAETDDGVNSISGTAEFSVNGANRADIDFGYTGALTISNNIFYDVDGDGIQDTGEPGLENVELTITFAGEDGIFGNDDDFQLSRTTGANGVYSVDNLPEGDYQLEVDTADLPAGMTVITSEYDDFGIANDGTATVTLTSASGSNSNVQFGFTGSLSVGDFVWFDADADGIQDSGEPGLSGVQLTLRYAGQDNTLFTGDDVTIETNTAADGSYAFTRLAEGNFQITVVPDAGTTPTYDADGIVGASANQSTFVLAAGMDDLTQDFGYRGNGSLEGTVFFDYVGDGGVLDATEQDRGLGSITVTLSIDVDGSPGYDYVTTTTTDGSGDYRFENLIAGTYDVTVTSTDLPDDLGNNPTYNPDGVIDNSSSILLAANENRAAVQFGYHGKPDYSITIDDSQTSVIPGEHVSYSITLQNNGTFRGQNVVVTETFPVNVLENLTATNGGVINLTDGTITWNLATVAMGESITFTVEGDVKDPIGKHVEDYTTSVTVSDDATNGIDPTTGNNSNNDLNTIVAEPDLELVVTNDLTGPAEPGQTFNYFLTVTNHGNQDVENISVTDVLPVDVLDGSTVLTDDAGNVVFDPVTGDLTWSAGEFAGRGGNKTLTVTVTVQDPLTTTIDEFSNNANVTENGIDWSDPDTSDNSSFNSIAVFAAPDYEIVKTSSITDSAMVGDSFTYTITVTNIGNQEGTGVVVTDYLPIQIVDRNAVYTDDPANVTYNAANGKLTWSVGSLVGRGDEAELTIFVTVPFVIEDPLADKIINTATVTDDGNNGSDPNLSNNRSTRIDDLIVFAFDSFNNLNGQNSDSANRMLFGMENGPDARQASPAPIDPIFSGLAEPGTTLKLRVFDDEGNIIGETQTTADMGGNWVASFPNAVIWKQPHRMEVEQTAPIQEGLDNSSGFNLRRYFHPAEHHSLFFAERETIQSIFDNTASKTINSMHEANLEPLQVGWRNHLYQMNVASSNSAAK